MGGTRVEMVLVWMTIVGGLWGGAMGQSNCQSVIISLAPCLNYITANSSTPSAACCTQLATVVQSQPRCLCEVINGGGISINQTLAMALPAACDVQTPPVSRCYATAPSGSPASPSNDPSGSGSGTGRSSGGDSSAGCSVKLPFSMLLFLLFVASYASTFNTI